MWWTSGLIEKEVKSRRKFLDRREGGNWVFQGWRGSRLYHV